MLQELWAKVTENERFVVYGGAAVLVGWVLGLILAGDWYSATGSQTLGLLAVVAAIAAVAVIYLRYAPNMNIAWPAPFPVILLGISAVAGVLALLGLVVSFTSDPTYGFGALIGASKPVTLYIAALVVAAGAAVMCWGGYQEWMLTKANTPPNPPTA